jgi:hypothetical protein
MKHPGNSAVLIAERPGLEPQGLKPLFVGLIGTTEIVP